MKDLTENAPGKDRHTGGDTRYRSIFQHSAVSLWEEDISGLRSALNALRSRGIADLEEYLDEHPEFIREAARMISVVDVNDAALRLYEVRSREELLGPLDTTLDLDDAMTVASLKRDILSIARGERHTERESRAVTPSGKKLTVNINLYIPGEKDLYPYMLVNVIDITERKRAEEELHRSRQLLQLVLDHIPQRVFWKDRNRRYIGCNKHFADDAGLSEPGAIVGKNDFELSWRDTADLYRADDSTVMDSGVPKVNYEESLTRPDGNLLWLRTSKVPLRDREGNVFGVLGTYEDITEGRRAEEALRESERHYRTLFDAAQRQTKEMELLDQVRTALAGELELPAVFRTVVEGLARTFGYTQVSLYLLKGDVLVCQHQVGYQRIIEEIPLERGIIGRVARTGKPLLLEDVRTDPDFLGAMDGIVSEVGIPLFDQGRVVGTLNVESTNGVAMGAADLRLMTALGEHVSIAIVKARMYAEALESEERLAQAQKMEAVGRLAGGIAHDFNNLLTVIKGYADLMDDGLGEANPMKADLREIRRAAERAADLISQLLAFSRKQVIQPRVLNLNDVVRAMQKMLPRVIGEDIEIATLLPPDLANCKADQGQIEQVIMNLAANARDAMPKGGVLTIATANQTLDESHIREHPEIVPGEYVMLTISDTGLGMDRVTLSRIFEPYFTTKEVGKGTGLGLAMVYGIVKQSNGFVYCTSDQGAGTTFRIYLPRVREGSAGEQRPEKQGETFAGDETVLLAEDEDAIRSFIASVLRNSGFTVMEARNGEEALSRISDRDPAIHLLLTDVVMPRMNGEELGRKVKAIFPGVKILYMSGYTEDSIVRHGILDGEIDLIQKPFDAKGLLKRVREVLDRGR